MLKLIIVFVIVSCNVFAQVQYDSLIIANPSFRSNQYSQKFNKQLNIFSLASAVKYQTYQDKFYFSLKDSYSSTFIETKDKTTRDENYFSFVSFYDISRLISMGTFVQNSILSDSRKIEINSASETNFALFTKINPTDYISFAPYFGYENNRQIGESDEGYIYGFEGLLNNLSLTDADVYSFIKFRNEDIAPRKNNFRDIRFRLKNSFDENINNIFFFSFSQTGRDYYYPADTVIRREFSVKNNIRNRMETTYSLQNTLEYYNFIPDFSMIFSSGINWRDINRNTKYRTLSNQSAAMYDTEISELRFELEGNIFYQNKLTNSMLRFNYSERDEKHSTKNIQGSNIIFYGQRSKLESQKNNLAQRMSLTIRSDINLSSKDILSLNFLQNKLRYDSPSIDNVDDRDELLSILRLAYKRNISPYFIFSSAVEGNLNKLVYILAARSSNNYTNRVLKFNSTGAYKNSYFSSINAVEVVANYTVYDFEDINPNYKSYSFRQLSFVDSSAIQISKRTALRFNGYLRLSEQGELSWKEFSSKPTRFLEEIFLHPRFVQQIGVYSFAIGFRHFSLKTFTYSGADRKEESYYSSVGPSTEISYNILNKLILNIDSWYEIINYGRENFRETVNFNFQLEWVF